MDDRGEQGEQGEQDDSAEMHTSLPPALEAWRRRTALGALMTGIAMGLQQVFDPNKDNRPAIVIQASGQPPDPNAPLSLEELDADFPVDTTVVVRPSKLPPSANH